LNGSTVTHSQTNALRTVLGDVEADTLLDVACGDGEFAELLLEHLPEIRAVTGIDPDRTELNEAQRYFARAHPHVRARFSSGRAERLPFADNAFRLVSLSNALHHFEDPERALLEVARVLASGGVLIVQEMRSDDLTPAQRNGRDLHHIKADIDVALGHNHRHTFTYEQTTDLVSRAGLSIEDVCEYDPEGGVMPPDQQIDDRIDFLVDYLEPLSGTDAYARIKRKVMKLSTSLRRSGFAPARQVVIRAARAG
jgi:SAM-dependent methyltransferase